MSEKYDITPPRTINDALNDLARKNKDNNTKSAASSYPKIISISYPSPAQLKNYLNSIGIRKENIINIVFGNEMYTAFVWAENDDDSKIKDDIY